MAELADDAVVLRPWRLSDADWYADEVKDAAIQHQTCEPTDLTAEQVRAAIARYADDPIHCGWAICAADTGELLGNAALDLAHGHISYWVATAARGRGVATAAVRLMAAHAFTASALDELRLWVRAGNAASARVAQKAGFTRSPDLDETVEIRGEPWETEYYTLGRPAPRPSQT